MASLFTKIVKGEIPGQVVFSDDQCFVIKDIQPQGPLHLLIIPRKELRSVDEAKIEDKNLLGHLLLIAAQVARDHGVAESGYRLIANTNSDGGQTVSHLHIHLIAGRPMTWPPG